MAHHKAATLDDEQFKEFLDEVTAKGRNPLVDRVAFLMSFHAGMRVQEIAGAQWNANLLDSRGEFRTAAFKEPGSRGRLKTVHYPVIWINSTIAKGGRRSGVGSYSTERTVALSRPLHDALTELRNEAYPGEYIIPTLKSGASVDLPKKAHALRMRLNRIYDDLGYEGASTHSGRRTFITKLARDANHYNLSLKDVQVMVGHKHLESTQHYIDISPMQAAIVRDL